jgi:hypothetical protein
VWFNSRQSEKPYQGLTSYRFIPLETLVDLARDGRTGAAWLSSARAVRCSLKWGNERNPRVMLHIHCGQSRLCREGRSGRRQVSTALIPWVTHTLQWRRTTCRKAAMSSKSLKFRLSSDWSLQPDSMKSESVVIADQQAAVNTFSGLVHTARQGSKVEGG